MNTPSQPNTEAQSPRLGSDQAERILRYKAGRCIEFLSTYPEFEQMQEKTNSFLQMGFVDLVDLHCMQIGYSSLEECYEHFVYHEPYGLANLNAEFERLRLAAIVGGKSGHDAILGCLAAIQPPESPVG